MSDRHLSPVDYDYLQTMTVEVNVDADRECPHGLFGIDFDFPLCLFGSDVSSN